MIVSWNWLTDYLRLDMPVEILTERLMLSGLNHESTEEVGGDLAIDLEVTSNRPDCLGHLGVAREIGVLFDRRVRFPDPRPKTSGASVETLTSVAVEEPALCPRFTARVVRGVKVGPSPFWLRKRLETIGVRPISNVVDVTNYVMFECGQPLHAYDLNRLAGKRLVVRRARKGETLVAINNKTYELTHRHARDRRCRAARRPRRRDGRGGDRGRRRDDRHPDRGRPVRRDVGPADVAGARAVQPVELPVRTPARPRDDRVGEPPLRRADPGDGRRDAPPGRDRHRHAETGPRADHAPAEPDPPRPRDHDRPERSPPHPPRARLEARGRPARGTPVRAAELAERPRARDRPDRGGGAGPRLRADPRGPARPAHEQPARRLGSGSRTRSGAPWPAWVSTRP